MTTPLARWRGLRALVGDAIEHGSRAVERVQKSSVRVPFGALEALPQRELAEVARGVHAVHDAAVTGVHAVIRASSKVLGSAVDLALTLAELRASAASKASPPTAAADPTRSPPPPAAGERSN